MIGGGWGCCGPRCAASGKLTGNAQAQRWIAHFHLSCVCRVLLVFGIAPEVQDAICGPCFISYVWFYDSACALVCACMCESGGRVGDASGGKCRLLISSTRVASTLRRCVESERGHPATHMHSVMLTHQHVHAHTRQHMGIKSALHMPTMLSSKPSSTVDWFLVSCCSDACSDAPRHPSRRAGSRS